MQQGSLWSAVFEEWRQLQREQGLVWELYASLPRRVRGVVQNNGAYSGYWLTMNIGLIIYFGAV